MAYVIFDSAESAEEVLKKYDENQPEIGNKKLRIFRYQPNAEMPSGMKFCLAWPIFYE